MQKIASPAQLAQEIQSILAYTLSGNPSRATIASKLQDLSFRVSGVRLAVHGTPLYGHHDMNSAYLVDDYPYGRTLRCKIRYWVESNPSKGYRFVSQTEDPRNGRWNTPKKSTYSLLGIGMYLDEKQHVVYDAITEYSDASKVLEFVRSFPQSDFSTLKVFASKKARFLQGLVDGSVYMTVNGEKQPRSEHQLGEDRKELDIWQDIAKLTH